MDGIGAAPVAKRPNVQMPDEYLPPNKILFLQNLPETVTKDQLTALFSQFRIFMHRSTIICGSDTVFAGIQICTKFV